MSRTPEEETRRIVDCLKRGDPLAYTFMPSVWQQAQSQAIRELREELSAANAAATELAAAALRARRRLVDPTTLMDVYIPRRVTRTYHELGKILEKYKDYCHES